MVVAALTGSNSAFLMTSKELYGPSYVAGVKYGAYTATTPKSIAMEQATYGSTRGFWGFNNIATDNNLTTSVWTHIVTVGTFKGKGIYTSIETADPATMVSANLASYTGYILTDTTYCASGVCEISAPSGGVGQFKGTT